MASLKFCLKRKAGLLERLCGKGTFKKLIESRWSVTFSAEGFKLGPVDTSWGASDASRIHDFIERFCKTPGELKAEPEIRRALHDFLFAGHGFDVGYDRRIRAAACVLVGADPRDRVFLANVPWELTDGVTLEGEYPTSTLSAVPLARTLIGSHTVIPAPEAGRLRVLYAVADADPAAPINGAAFRTTLERTLSDRAVFLDFASVREDGVCPRMAELLAEIDRQAPHVLIVVCHGKTTNGSSHILMERWHPIVELVSCVARNGKTLLVGLIACDQTHLEGHAAQSGALAFSEAGIPFVVAMQSSVRVAAAGVFLGSLIDTVFRTGSVPKAVAAGRLSMAPTARVAKETIDWAFPALFVTEDFPESGFRPIIESYSPMVEALVRKIPPVEPYLRRPSVERELGLLLQPDVSGVRFVVGGVGMGKSASVRTVCRSVLMENVRSRGAGVRPILYVDFSRHPDVAVTPGRMWAAVKRETEEVRLGETEAGLIIWPALGGVEGQMDGEVRTSEWLAALDRNRMVLVLDETAMVPDGELEMLARQAAGLAKSLVIIVQDEPTGNQGDDSRVVRVGPLNQEETSAYQKRFGSGLEKRNDWFEQTGGCVLLLDELRRGGRPLGRRTELEKGISPGIVNYVRMIAEGLSEGGFDLACVLTHLRRGVNSRLGWDYLSNWASIEELLDSGILLRDYRFGLSDFWVRLPGLISETLRREWADRVASAGEELASSFVEAIGAEGDDGVSKEFIRLLQTPGGIEFLHDVQQVLLEHDVDAGRGLATMVHQWLFQHGKWGDAYLFLMRAIDKVPPAQTEAHEWLKLAKVSHVLGRGGEAREFLEKARSRQPTLMDEVVLLDQEAALDKDSGNKDRLPAIVENYKRALTLLEQLEREGSQGDAPEDIGEKRGIIYYNRALFRAFWLRETEDACSDLDSAIKCFKAHGNRVMTAMAECEKVDVRLASVSEPGGCDDMIRRLLEAEEMLSGAENKGDRAFCLYQLGRCYRKLATLDVQRADNARAKAITAYREASRLALDAGDMRQRAIAEVHAVELAWLSGNVSAVDAASLAGEAVDALEVFKGDAWASRVRRDSMMLRARALMAAGEQGAREVLERAWGVATLKPLDARSGTDARRAAEVFLLLLEELRRGEYGLDADRLLTRGRELVQVWLGREIVAVRLEDYIEQLRQFARH